MVQTALRRHRKVVGSVSAERKMWKGSSVAMGPANARYGLGCDNECGEQVSQRNSAFVSSWLVTVMTACHIPLLSECFVEPRPQSPTGAMPASLASTTVTALRHCGGPIPRSPCYMCVLGWSCNSKRNAVYTACGGPPSRRLADCVSDVGRLPPTVCRSVSLALGLGAGDESCIIILPLQSVPICTWLVRYPQAQLSQRSG